MHRLLERQLRKCFGRTEELSPELAAFVALVDGAYSQSDSDRAMIERSMDLSSRELLERNHALAVAEAKYRTIFENVTDGLFQITPEGRFLSANPAMARLVGYERPEDLLREVTDVAAQLYVDAKQCVELFKEVEARGAVTNRELQVRRKDGAVAWASMSCAAVCDPQRKLLYLQGSNRDITAQKSVEAERAMLQQRLVDAAWQAGMAEVAIGVLHNVGNVLNSVNVSTAVITEKVRGSRVTGLSKAVTLMGDHEATLAEFLANDAKGKQLLGYLRMLSEALAGEQKEILSELDSLNRNVEHIKQIVATQQSFASPAALNEPVDLAGVIEDAIRINTLALGRHGVRVERNFEKVPTAVIERHKLLQILVNLISNAKWACSAGGDGSRTVRISLGQTEERKFIVEIRDTGIGIAADDIQRIFEHGFSRRKGGHGFGLHTSALAAKSMGGSLRAQSEGNNRGATFTVEFPGAATPGVAAAA
jgi:PAS domain S-box-containing protein